MKKFFFKVWKIFKPLNKWHVAAYFIVFCLAVYDQVTQPPSKVISDYKRVEGVAVKVGSPKGRVGSYGVRLKVGDEVLVFVFSGGNYKLYRSWKNKKVVVYYWPKHILNLDNKLVLMAPPSQEKAYLASFNKNNGFNNPSIGHSAKTLIFLMFFQTWLIPFLIRLMLKIRKERANDNIFITK